MKNWIDKYKLTVWINEEDWIDKYKLTVWMIILKIE